MLASQEIETLNLLVCGKLSWDPLPQADSRMLCMLISTVLRAVRVASPSCLWSACVYLSCGDSLPATVQIIDLDLNSIAWDEISRSSLASPEHPIPV